MTVQEHPREWFTITSIQRLRAEQITSARVLDLQASMKLEYARLQLFHMVLDSLNFTRPEPNLSCGDGWQPSSL
jgi:hypothetical protein